MAYLWERFLRTQFRVPHLLVRVFVLVILLLITLPVFMDTGGGPVRTLSVWMCLAAAFSAVLLAAKVRATIWCFWGMLVLGSLPFVQEVETALNLALFYGGVVVFSSSWRQNIVNLFLLLTFYIPRSLHVSALDVFYSLVFGVGISFFVPLSLRLLIEHLDQQRSDFQVRIDWEERLLEESRKELARELHDVVARELTIIALHSSMARVSDNQELRDNTFDLIGQQSRSTLNNLRRLVKILRSDNNPAIAPELFSADVDIAAVAEQMRSDVETAGYVVDLRLEGNLTQVPDELKPTTQRILEELGINVIKHGRPDQPVNVSLLVESTLFRITCQNAVGDPQYRKEYLSMGYGLAGLRERCELLGGIFSSDRVEDKWQVDITLPIGA